MDHECILVHNKVFNTYYFYVVIKKDIIDIINRNEIVALDPGELIFLAFNSLEHYGKLGHNMRVKILKAQRITKRLQSVLDKNINMDGKKIKNRSKLKKEINKMYRRIKGYVNEVHKIVAKYLCENYKIIILPDFKTKPMLGKKRE